MEYSRELGHFDPDAHAKSEQRHFFGSLSYGHNDKWIFTYLFLALVIGVSINLIEKEHFDFYYIHHSLLFICY
jgi:hypothetical protein